MPKIAGTYDYKDPRDPSDTFDRFERPDYEPRDKEGGSAERGRPFTAAEIEYFEFRQGITICPTPVQPEPKPPGLNKMQETWALTFDPLTGVDEATATCRELLGLVNPTKPKTAAKLARIQSVIKGVPEGGTFADVAAELGQERAVISRDTAEAYQKWPKLERPLLFLNSLNNMAKRREVSTPWQFALRMGEQISDDGILIWGEWPRSGPTNHVAEPDHVVKLTELQHRVFPQIRSNCGAMLARYLDEAPRRGSQRIERVHYDKWGYETERTDGNVRTGAPKDRDRLDDSIDAWQRLRKFMGLSPTCRWLACHSVLFEMLGHEFFRAETRQRNGIRPEPPAGLPASFLDAPWINPGYLIPTGAVDTPVRYKAPYVPFVNECKPGKQRELHPSKYPAKASRYRGNRLRAERFAPQVHNATAYGPDANKQFLNIRGVAEPNPAWKSADVSVHRMVRSGDRWKRGRRGVRCAPINSSLSSLPPLTRFFQFPLLPWEAAYAEYFNTPGPRPNRPPDAVNASGFRSFI